MVALSKSLSFSHHPQNHLLSSQTILVQVQGPRLNPDGQAETVDLTVACTLDPSSQPTDALSSTSSSPPFFSAVVQSVEQVSPIQTRLHYNLAFPVSCFSFDRAIHQIFIRSVDTTDLETASFGYLRDSDITRALGGVAEHTSVCT